MKNIVVNRFFTLIYALVISFASSFVFSVNYEYKLAMCTMFKNEAPFLKEWIEYHRMIGVEHFYLYNNDSDDDFDAVLKPYIEKNIVELIDWHSCPEHGSWDRKYDTFIPYQISAFNDCFKNRALGKSQWVAVIDVDEFIVPLYGKESLIYFLDDKAANNVGSVSFFWRCFGTSEIDDLKEGDLVTEKFIRRAANSHNWHSLTKCIHRPEAIGTCMVHHAENFVSPYISQKITTQMFRINHYWFRSRNFTMKRRKMTVETLLDYEKPFNAVYDISMQQYLEELKERCK
jgi:hypothetical protein